MPQCSGTGLAGFPANAPPPVMVTEEDKTLAMLCHLLAIFTGFLGPLVVWLVKKDRSPFIDHHGREALNFQITLLLVMLGLGSATFILMFVFVGILLIPVMMVVGILALVAEILAAIAAQNGAWHRYPCNLRLINP
jgi:uncharacterized protein